MHIRGDHNSRGYQNTMGICASHDEKIEGDPRENDTNERVMGARLAELLQEGNPEKHVPNVTRGLPFIHTGENHMDKYPFGM